MIDDPQLQWLQKTAAMPNTRSQQAARQRQAQLTKPAGALGRLETLAIELAALQGSEQPQIKQVFISVFAADHGVAAEQISAYPQAVTAQMLANFAQGGAAIAVAARALNANLQVVNLGTAADPGSLPKVRNVGVGPGTANLAYEPAMSQQQLAVCLNQGQLMAQQAQQDQCELFIGGEMGIGNTTAATAIACALLNLSPDIITGPGTGLNAEQVRHKADVIKRALDTHSLHLSDTLEVLRCLGGFEIAALVGSYLACAQLGMAVLVDGFISSVAALVSVKLLPSAAPWLLYSHCSAEPGHRLVLDALSAQPLLDLGMRLGEGSGAAVAVPLLRMACELHNEMATFTSAGVSDRQSAP